MHKQTANGRNTTYGAPSTVEAEGLQIPAEVVSGGVLWVTVKHGPLRRATITSAPLSETNKALATRDPARIMS